MPSNVALTLSTSPLFRIGIPGRQDGASRTGQRNRKSSNIAGAQFIPGATCPLIRNDHFIDFHFAVARREHDRGIGRWSAIPPSAVRPRTWN